MIRHFSLSSWLVALAVSWANAPGSAVACEPCDCRVPWGIRPAVEQQDLPRNARFMVDLNGASVGSAHSELTLDSLQLVKLEGMKEIAFTTVPAGEDPLVVWVVPEERFEADTTYEIKVGDGKPTLLSERFTTSALVDDSPPEVNAPRVERVRTSACGSSATARLVWDAIHDNGEEMRYEPIVRARIGNGEREVELFLDAKNLVPGRGTELAAPLDQGSEDCWGHFGVPFKGEEVLKVQLTVYDRAGNETDLESVDVSLSPDPGGECPNAQGDCRIAATAPHGVIGRVGIALMVIVVGMFVIRRRRRAIRH